MGYPPINRKVVILDPKGTFMYFNLKNIAHPFMANLVREWWGDPTKIELPNMKFYIPRYGPAFFNIRKFPTHITPAPIATSMIGEDTLKLIGWHILERSDYKKFMRHFNFFDPHSQSLHSLKRSIISKGDMTVGIANLFASGLLADDSPLKGEKIVNSDADIIIVTAGPIIGRGMMAFFFGTILYDLYFYLKRAFGRNEVLVLIDEMSFFVNQQTMTDSGWWFSFLLTDIMSRGRQIGMDQQSCLRLGIGTQFPNMMPPVLSFNARLAFLGPRCFAAEGPKRYMRNVFKLPKNIEVATDVSPGSFLVLDQDKGLIDFFYFPPSPEFILEEPNRLSPEDQERQEHFLNSHVTWVSMEDYYWEYKRKQEELGELLGLRMAPGSKGSEEDWPYHVSIGKGIILYYMWKMFEEGYFKKHKTTSRREILNRLLRDHPALVKFEDKLIVHLAPQAIMTSGPRSLVKLGIGVKHDPTKPKGESLRLLPMDGFAEIAEEFVNKVDAIGGILAFIAARSRTIRQYLREQGLEFKALSPWGVT